MSSFEQLIAQALQIGLSGAEVGRYVIEQQAFWARTKFGKREYKVESVNENGRARKVNMKNESESDSSS